LRITRVEDAEAGTTLCVEGRVVGDAVGLLERECRRALQEVPGVRLDVGGVTIIDGRGVMMLRCLRAAGARVLHCSPFVEHLLDGAVER
jgi:hypothetical protein